MGLISTADRRPRDWAYKVAFDRKDLPSLEEMARHIRDTHDIAMIEDFNLKCEQKLSGEPVTLGNALEIKSVTKSDDLVVNTGLQHCINLILGTSSARFSHFGMSPGNVPAPAITDTTLYESAAIILYRVPLAWVESIGMKIFFGGISSQTDSTPPGAVAPFSPGSIGEIGVYNSGIAGAVLLNRSQFVADAITQNTVSFSLTQPDPLVVSCVIEFCPIA